MGKGIKKRIHIIITESHAVIYCMVISSLLVSCKQKIEAQSLDNSIVIIFKDFPEYPKRIELFKNLWFENSLPFISLTDQYHQFLYTPDPSKKFDTIRFNPKGEYVLLTHAYNTFHSFDYLLVRGDTVLYTYTNGLPFAKLLNKRKANTIINYEFESRKTLSHGNPYTPCEIYKYPALAVNDLNEFFKRSRLIKKENYSPAKSFLLRERLYLDSVNAKERLPAFFYNFFRDKIMYQIAQLDYEENHLGRDTIRNYLALNLNADQNIPYSYFVPFLEQVTDSVIVKNVRVLKFANGKDYDYRQVFDSIFNWTEIGKKNKEVLLYKYLNKIGIMFSVNELEHYYKKYSQIAPDSFFLDKISTTYSLSNTDFINARDSLYLLDNTGKRISFNAFLIQNRGHVIYVDFWASWCLPCRAAMPDSKKLRTLFKRKNVVFAYLSIDKNAVDWKNASKKEGINTMGTNFFVLNPDNSSYLKLLNFETIPRYLLFDKHGNIIHKNAPSPGSPEIKRLINVY